MPLGEKEHLEAIRNQLARRVQHHEQRLEALTKSTRAHIAKLCDRIRAIEDVRQTLSEGLDDAGDLPIEADDDKGRIPVMAMIDRFIQETGKGAEGFSAANVVTYLKAQGWPVKKWTYNTVFEALTKKVKRGELRKEQGRFYG